MSAEDNSTISTPEHPSSAVKPALDESGFVGFEGLDISTIPQEVFSHFFRINDDQTKSNRYQCKVCNYVFTASSSTRLKQHVMGYGVMGDKKYIRDIRECTNPFPPLKEALVNDYLNNAKTPKRKKEVETPSSLHTGDEAVSTHYKKAKLADWIQNFEKSTISDLSHKAAALKAQDTNTKEYFTETYPHFSVEESSNFNVNNSPLKDDAIIFDWLVQTVGDWSVANDLVDPGRGGNQINSTYEFLKTFCLLSDNTRVVFNRFASSNHLADINSAIEEFTEAQKNQFKKFFIKDNAVTTSSSSKPEKTTNAAAAIEASEQGSTSKDGEMEESTISVVAAAAEPESTLPISIDTRNINHTKDFFLTLENYIAKYTSYNLLLTEKNAPMVKCSVVIKESLPHVSPSSMPGFWEVCSSLVRNYNPNGSSSNKAYGILTDYKQWVFYKFENNTISHSPSYSLYSGDILAPEYTEQIYSIVRYLFEILTIPANVNFQQRAQEVKILKETYASTSLTTLIENQRLAMELKKKDEEINRLKNELAKLKSKK